MQTRLSREKLVQASKLNTIKLVMFALESLSIKISIALLLLRIFGTRRIWRWLIWAIMSFVSISILILAAMILSQCRPLRKIWNPEIPGSCWRSGVVINIAYFNGGKLSLSPYTRNQSVLLSHRKSCFCHF